MAGDRGKLCPETLRPLSVRHDRGAQPYPGYPQLVESAHQPQAQLFGQREDHVFRLAFQFTDPAGT